MRTALTLALSLASVLTVVFGGMQVASALMTEEAVHAFPEAAVASLWTSEPTRVDPSRQVLERLPPKYVVAPRNIDKPVIVASAAPEIDRVETGALEPDAGLPLAHLDWCAGRYRSYDAADNSYQPYDGPRRACVSPYLDEGMTAGTSDPYDTAVDGPGTLPTATLVSANDYSVYAMEPATGHQAWCADRYRSYRSSDNSYKPYDGPRQQCLSPYSY